MLTDESGQPLSSQHHHYQEKKAARRSEPLFLLPDIQPRVSNDTFNIDALTFVAPTVRFNALEILFTPALDFAIVFSV